MRTDCHIDRPGRTPRHSGRKLLLENEPVGWYMKARWHHDFDDEPVQLFSEIGDDDYEVRKVDVYRDGHLEWADAAHETDTIGLGQVPTPPMEEINAEAEFTAVRIDAAEFEAVWSAARGRVADIDLG
jgi:hypothetical protein